MLKVLKRLRIQGSNIRSIIDSNGDAIESITVFVKTTSGKTITLDGLDPDSSRGFEGHVV